MIDYRKGDALTVRTPDGIEQTFRVMGVERDSTQPDALTVSLRRIEGSPARPVSMSVLDALQATSEPSIAVGPLAQKLAAYRVRPVKVGDDDLGGLMVEHDPCVWFQVVSAKLELSLAHLVALALEHHLAGCKAPR